MYGERTFSNGWILICDYGLWDFFLSVINRNWCKSPLAFWKGNRFSIWKLNDWEIRSKFVRFTVRFFTGSENILWVLEDCLIFVFSVLLAELRNLPSQIVPHERSISTENKFSLIQHLEYTEHFFPRFNKSLTFLHHLFKAEYYG